MILYNLLLSTLLLSAPAAWCAESSGGPWELLRSVPGNAGQTKYVGGGYRLGQSIGEANGAAQLSGGVYTLLSGYLSQIPVSLSTAMVNSLISSGNASDSGTTMVLASNNSVQVVFNNDIDPLTIAGIGVSAVLDPLGNPLAGAQAVTTSYDGLLPGINVAPTIGNWPLGTYFDVYVPKTIQDINGGMAVDNTTFTFTTIRDPLTANVALVRSQPAARVQIPPNTFTAPFLLMLSSGANTPNVTTANTKMLSFGPERKPIMILNANAYNNLGQPWATPLNQGVPFTLPYPDVGGTGIVDGTSPAVRTRTLSIWALDATQNLWVKQNGASLNSAARNLTYVSNRVAAYAVFGATDRDVSDVFAFPVPFRPNAGDPTRFGTWAEGIKFNNLPSEGAIKIYTSSGRLVRQLDITSPLQAWNGTNSSGQQVASGLYLWEVISGSNHKSGKILIIK